MKNKSLTATDKQIPRRNFHLRQGDKERREEAYRRYVTERIDAVNEGLDGNNEQELGL